VGRSIFYIEPPLLAETPPRAADSLGVPPSEAEAIQPPRAVRTWEFLSAPFVPGDEALRIAGRCREVRPSHGMGRAPAALRRSDRMTITTPGAVASDTGLRFIIARPGPMLEGIGRAVTPTGIVRIVRSATSTSPAEAEVVAQFDKITCENILLAFSLPGDTSSRRPAPVASGSRGRVVWVASDALLPTLQHHVLIDLGAAAVRPGDQVMLFAPQAEGAAGTPSEAAIATVLRAGARSSSAMIIRQARAAILNGAPVRVSAKLP
jgi:hypothetical protein